MLIIGASGFAKEVLDVLVNNSVNEKLLFFDNVSTDTQDLFLSKYQILRDFESVKIYFGGDFDFNIGIGGPQNRLKFYNHFVEIGGFYKSIISADCKFGNFEVQIGDGCNIMQNVWISSSVNIGKGVILNVNSTIGHDVRIGDFVEICPGVNVSGGCAIGNGTFIGTNATILPKVSLGSNVVVGAGSVVREDVGDNVMVAGVPAKVLKRNI